MSELYELPKGWKWKTFDEVSTFIRGVTFKPNEKYDEPNENTIFCFRTTNIQTELDDTDLLNIDYKATLGGFIVCGRANQIILDSKYYYYYFSSEENQKKMRNLANKTTGIANLPMKKVEKEYIPLPPLEEQKMIVEKLDLLFGKIDKAIELHQKNIDEADIFMAIVLNDIFEEFDTNETIELKYITSKIGSGSTPRGGQKAYKMEGITLIRSMNVHDNGFRIKGLAFIDDKQANQLNNVTVKENDILLNITGASVARCFIVDKNYLPARVNQHVSIIRLDDRFITQFLHYYLINPSIKSDLLFSSSGGATREAITKSMLEEFKVPKVSINIQQKVVSYLDKISNKIEKIKEIQKEKMQSLKELKASILDKAFKGEL